MGSTKNSNPKKSRSRLCNKELFLQFMNLVSLASIKGYPHIPEQILALKEKSNVTYLAVKRNGSFNKDLKEATAQFFQHFSEWTRTPDQYLNFKLD